MIVRARRQFFGERAHIRGKSLKSARQGASSAKRLPASGNQRNLRKRHVRHPVDLPYLLHRLVPFGLVFAKPSAVSTPARPEAATGSDQRSVCGKAWGRPRLPVTSERHHPRLHRHAYSTSSLSGRSRRWRRSSGISIPASSASRAAARRWRPPLVSLSSGVLAAPHRRLHLLFLIWRSGFVRLVRWLVTAMPILLALSGKFGLLPSADHPRAGLLEPPRKHPPSRQGREKTWIKK